MTMTEVEENSCWQGRIRILQFRNGYRFSIDAILLASFVRPGVRETIMDLGTGCGIIPLLLAYHHPEISVAGVELQPDLAELARQNVRLNTMEHRISILHQDIRNLPLAWQQGGFDRVVSNPPYRKIRSGRINPADQKAVARHELSVTLKDIVHASTRLLKKGGRLDMIYGTDRMADLITEMRRHHIEPKRIRMIHPDILSPSAMFLVSGVRGANPGGLRGDPPLFIHEADGRYTREVTGMLAPEETPTARSEQRIDRQSGNDLRIKIG